jgi:transcriptional regulator with XRE-family HTH domain
VNDSSFPSWLRGLREQRDVPLRVVAAAAEMDSTLLSKLELGGRLPTDAQALALARYYKIPAEEMRRRVVAGRILQQFGDDPALHDAISLVREETGAPSKPLPPPKPVKYPAKRRLSR